MDAITLNIAISQTPDSDPERPQYQVEWSEHSETKPVLSPGVFCEHGPAGLLEDHSEEGVLRVCAWLVSVAWAKEGKAGGLGWAIVRMDERADMPADFYARVKLATIEARLGQAVAWQREWPYAHDLDSLWRRGDREAFALRLDRTLPAGNRPPAPRF